MFFDSSCCYLGAAATETLEYSFWYNYSALQTKWLASQLNGASDTQIFTLLLPLFQHPYFLCYGRERVVYQLARLEMGNECLFLIEMHLFQLKYSIPYVEHLRVE